jgi:hypothetical protein
VGMRLRFARPRMQRAEGRASSDGVSFAPFRRPAVCFVPRTTWDDSVPTHANYKAQHGHGYESEGLIPAAPAAGDLLWRPLQRKLLRHAPS